MTAEKGPQRAIRAARMTSLPLILAGPVQPGQEQFFEREIAGARKRRLFAHARALLMPIRWPEPFGMVMLEAMVCGTPVVAFPEGAARELVIPGVTGLLVADEAEMAAACERVALIDPADCRSAAVERFDVRRVAALYERIYARLVEPVVARRPTDGRRHRAGAGAGRRSIAAKPRR
jgi:glycosyltransferase involved in cell wall biosynthesis